MKRKRRAGFSLMEVMLAASILLGSVIVLAQLANIGRHHVEAVEELTVAQLLCQSKMNELLAGIVPIEEVEDEAMVRDPNWVYTVELEPFEDMPLVALKVTVKQYFEGEVEAEMPRKPKHFTLVQWIPASAVETLGQDSSFQSLPDTGTPLLGNGGYLP